MRSIRKQALFTLLFLTFCAGALLAQQPAAPAGGVGVNTYPICGHEYDSAHPWSWASLSEIYADQLEAEDYKAIAAGVRYRVEVSTNQRDATIKRKFLHQIDALGNQIERARTFVFTKSFVGGQSHLLLFQGTGDMIDFLNCGNGQANALQLDELRYAAHAMVSLAGMLLEEPQKKAAERVAEIDAQFERYIFEGFPMYPWEALINGWLVTDDELGNGPPHHQIVLLHPGAAIQVQTTEFSEADPEFALLLEVLGWNFYPKSRDYNSWFGASLVASYADDKGMGAGVLFRYEDFSLGVTWQDLDDDNRLFDDDPAIFVSWELYQFAGEKVRKYRDYRQKIHDKAAEFVKSNQ